MSDNAPPVAAEKSQRDTITVTIAGIPIEIPLISIADAQRTQLIPPAHFAAIDRAFEIVARLRATETAPAPTLKAAFMEGASIAEAFDVVEKVHELMTRSGFKVAPAAPPPPPPGTEPAPASDLKQPEVNPNFPGVTLATVT